MPNESKDITNAERAWWEIVEVLKKRNIGWSVIGNRLVFVDDENGTEYYPLDDIVKVSDDRMTKNLQQQLNDYGKVLEYYANYKNDMSNKAKRILSKWKGIDDWI